MPSVWEMLAKRKSETQALSSERRQAENEDRLLLAHCRVTQSPATEFTQTLFNLQVYPFLLVVPDSSAVTNPTTKFLVSDLIVVYSFSNHHVNFGR